jgi:DNA-binding transcriptional LysR family regulator
MDLADLRIFKTVAEEGGITRAASRLNRVQSNITTRVKQLEAKLGATLFIRENRRLKLSAEGKVLLDYADQLLRLSAEAEAALRDGAPRGTLKLGTMESTAAVRLPALLSRYHAAYPQVRIQLFTATSGALINKLLAYEVEAAFVATPFAGDGLDSVPVFEETLVLIAPRGFRKIVRPKDVSGATVIAFGAGCTYRRCLEEWLARERIVPAQVMEFASYHTIVACVAAGTGVAIVPKSVLQAVAGGADVVSYPLPAHSAKTQTHLVWRQGYRSSALDALRDALLTRAKSSRKSARALSAK